MTVVDVLSLRVDYDEVTAVNDISFRLERGKVYGFVGPNGAGKTSTIKALAGVLEPTRGTVIINGFNLETEREQALRHVGYMPDFPPVYENLKVWEYLDVFLAAYGVDWRQRPGQVEQWLGKADLLTKRDALVKGLSRGMRQRLVLAKTLEFSPSILLMDEPASGLDPVARRQMRDLLKEASAGGATVLISSHILTELSDFVDAVIILEKGRVVVSGTIDEVREQTGSTQKLSVRFENEEEGLKHFKKLLEEKNIPGERVSRDRTYHVIHFPDDTREGFRFLKELMATGVVLTECFLKHDDVEDIFHKIGAKEVS